MTQHVPEENSNERQKGERPIFVGSYFLCPSGEADCLALLAAPVDIACSSQVKLTCLSIFLPHSQSGKPIRRKVRSP